MSTQLNVRTTPVLINELDKVVSQGYFRNRTEAVNEALRILVRRYHIMKLEGRMQKVSEKNKGLPSITKAVINAHTEEDYT
jgi:Arc/MetJ-type ribon-helix-helix transcriptional regulator